MPSNTEDLYTGREMWAAFWTGFGIGVTLLALVNLIVFLVHWR